MRTINASILAELESEQLRPFLLLSWTIDGTAYGYTDCDVPLNVPTGELIVNGGMEIDDNWLNLTSPTVNERSNAQAHSGTYSRKFTADSAWDGIKSDVFAQTAGMVYRVSLWVYPDDGTTVSLLIRKGDDTGWTSTVNEIGLAQDAWNLVTFEYTADVTGSLGYISISSGASVAGTWYIDEVSVTQRNVYTPLGFKFSNIRYSLSNIVDKVDIEIDNLDMIQTAIFVDGTPQGSDVVLSLVVLDANLKVVNTSAVTLFEGEIDSWQLNERSLRVTVTSIFYSWSQRTLSKHSPSCRWKEFKSTECDYVGGSTWCDRTYIKCTLLENSTNFGGFRWLPSIIDREIWWGRVQGVVDQTIRNPFTHK